MNHSISDDEATGTTLPPELLTDIFCRLPVKLLLQLRCICKEWNSFISGTQFTNDYLRNAKASHNHHHLMFTTKTESYPYNQLLWDSPIPSILTTTLSQSPLSFPDILDTNSFTVCSCDGILCFTIHNRYPLLWNPSTRKLNVISPVENMFTTVQRRTTTTRRRSVQHNIYSFGYDITTNKYKIVALSSFCHPHTPKVCIYTLCSDPTNSWKRINDFPGHGSISKMGLFVSGTINWLVSSSIIYLDLATEEYRQLLLPNTTGEASVTFGVLKDCLCLFVHNNMGLVVWMMKEFGNNESWNISYKIPYVEDQRPYSKVLYITADEQLIMYTRNAMQLKVGFYDSKNGTFNMAELQHNSWMDPIVYVDSFTSPCSSSYDNLDPIRNYNRLRGWLCQVHSCAREVVGKTKQLIISSWNVTFSVKLGHLFMGFLLFF